MKHGRRKDSLKWGPGKAMSITFSQSARNSKTSRKTLGIIVDSKLSYPQHIKPQGRSWEPTTEAALGWIVGVEPLQDKLDDMSASWAARVLRTGDQNIRDFPEKQPAGGSDWWHNGRIHMGTWTAIDLAERSYGEDNPMRTDRPQPPGPTRREIEAQSHVGHLPEGDCRQNTDRHRGRGPSEIQGQKARITPGHGVNRSEWNRQSLSACT